MSTVLEETVDQYSAIKLNNENGAVNGGEMDEQIDTGDDEYDAQVQAEMEFNVPRGALTRR
jgi:hypothetical protein